MLKYSEYYEVIEEIKKGTNINLHGKMGTGKTLTMKALVQDATSFGRQSLYIDAQEIPSPEKLWEKIAIGFGISSQQPFSRFVQAVRAQQRGLFIDECDYLFREKALEGIFDGLRAISNGKDVSLVCASMRPISDITKSRLWQSSIAFLDVQINKQNSHHVS